MASRVVLVAKKLPADAGDVRGRDLISGSGRSPGEGNGSPLQYSCLENPRTEEPVRLQSMGVAKTRLKWLSMHAHNSYSVIKLAWEKVYTCSFKSFQNQHSLPPFSKLLCLKDVCLPKKQWVLFSSSLSLFFFSFSSHFLSQRHMLLLMRIQVSLS